MVTSPLEHRQSRDRERLELVDVSVSSEPEPARSGDDARERLTGFVAGHPCALGRRLRQRGSPSGIRQEEKASEVQLELDVEPERPGQLERPFEQGDGRGLVNTPERPPTGTSEMLPGALAERRVRLSELGCVAGGLLQVVAEELVQLDEVLPPLLEPGGEALVELGAARR